MIILVNPMWSVEHLNKDSNYVHIKKIIERFTQLYPDTYFIVPFPSRHFKYYEDGLFQNPNVVRVPYVIPLAKKINNITFDGAFFNRVVEQYGVGLIYNQIPEVTGQLKSLDSHFSSTIPIINACRQNIRRAKLISSIKKNGFKTISHTNNHIVITF